LTKIIDHKDAINRRLYNHQSFVETAIYRVSCLNRTVLQPNVSNYDTTRADASVVKLQQAYQAMLALQQAETEKLTLYRAAADAARLAEWEFHNAVLAMKEFIRGQYGSDSDQAQAVGLKKKSDRKRSKRKKSVAIAS
jgi:phosphoribosylformylglycinamidine (FGAM) synthase-like enzyme